jgi:hypothetical protein
MPIDVAVETTSGTQTHYIPLDLMRGGKKGDIGWTYHADWPWVYRSYTLELSIPLSSVKKITIDPSTWMADVEPADNVWPAIQQGSNFFETK